MYKEKFSVDAKQDLGLYIEGLLTVEVESEIVEAVNVYNEPEQQAVIEKDAGLQVCTPVVSGRQEQVFDCLNMTVAGMQLLLPTRCIAYVERVEQTLTRLPVEHDAFLGMISSRNRCVAVIDVCAFISEFGTVAVNKDHQVTEDYIGHAIIMEGARYAIACDDVGRIDAIQADSVRWNKSSSRNRFYSGIVIEELSPLINIDAIDDAVVTIPFVRSINVQQE